MADKRKGFRIPERIVTLYFEEAEADGSPSPYAGMEVEVSLTTTVGFLVKMAGYAEGEASAWTLDEILGAMREWAEFQLRGWNLEDGAGKPIPATPEAYVSKVDAGTQAVILRQWIAAVKAPPGESSPPSPAGGTSVAE